MKTLIRSGEVVSGDGVFLADVLVADGMIKQVGKNLKDADAEVIDAKGMLVFPGFIDTHTHLEMNNGVARTADDFTTGTRAAVAGGTTTILDFATQSKGETLGVALANWHALADGKSACDYGFHMAITDWNKDVAAEIADMTAAGVTSYKLYMAYDMLRVSDATVYEVLRAVKEQGGIVGMHCENGDLADELVRVQLAQGHTEPWAHPLSRPDAVEAEAVNRYLTIAELADSPVNIVHLSTKKGMEVVLRARANGQTVYVETCPQYLLLDDSNYERAGFEGAKYVMSPPLRKREDIAALWGAVALGEVDTIGTDHCSFCFHGQKDLGKDDFSKIPNGAPGVDLRPQLLYTYGVGDGRIATWDMCRLLASNPAKLFGMYPQKGAIQAGSDADIVIWDKEYAGTVTNENQKSACDYTPYAGFAVKGRPAYVLLRGQVVVRDGNAVREGMGQYVARGECQFWR